MIRFVLPALAMLISADVLFAQAPPPPPPPVISSSTVSLYFENITRPIDTGYIMKPKGTYAAGGANVAREVI
ncbi:MAG: hypothetical protein ACRCZF_17760, partial [Gemmataceae bacterium]